MTRSELIAALREAKGAIQGIEAINLCVNAEGVFECDDESLRLFMIAIDDDMRAIGAAVALVERVRPGWHWATATLPNNKAMAAIGNLADRGKEPPTLEAATPAIALLIALLESHDAKPEGK